jgi:hypothetical protein
MKKDQNAQKVIIENEQRTRTRGRSTVKVKKQTFSKSILTVLIEQLKVLMRYQFKFNFQN